jgi:hypothetical protein
MERVPPSERTKAALRSLLRDGGPELKSDLMRLSVRRVVEEALEAAAQDLLERGYYERRGPEGEGYRNGYREGRLQTSEGEVAYAVPQVREASAEQIKRIREAVSGRTEDVDSHVIPDGFLGLIHGAKGRGSQIRPSGSAAELRVQNETSGEPRTSAPQTVTLIGASLR